MLKALTLWIKTNCGKLLKKWDYQTTLPVSWETCIQFKKQQLETDMEQLTGSKLGKQYIKAVYCHSAIYLIYRVHNVKFWAGWITGWIKIAGRNINNLRYADDTTLLAENEEELKRLFTRVKKWSEKAA